MADNYWKKRQNDKLTGIMKQSEVSAKEIGDAYYQSSQYLQGKMEGIFQRYAYKHHLTTTDALQLIKNAKNYDYDELMRQLKANPSTQERKDLIAMLESPAYQSRIARLKAMNDQVDSVMHRMYGIENDRTYNALKNAVQSSYYHDIYNIGSYIGYEVNFATLDDKMIDKIVRSKWSGKMFSERIWDNTNETANELKKEMMVHFLTGKTEKEMADTIANRLGVEAFKARRLVETETAAVISETDQQTFSKYGIERERFSAIHDTRTSPVCRHMDGTIIETSKGVPGVNIPPMHPFCRSVMLPLFDEDIEESMMMRERDPKTGKNRFVRANKTYPEWYKEYVEVKPEAKKYDKPYSANPEKDQYERYRSVLKDMVPDTFEAFINLKYNDGDWWTDKKAQYRIVNRYKVDHGEVTPQTILDLDAKAVRAKCLMKNSHTRKEGNIAIANIDGNEYIAHSKIDFSSSENFKDYRGDKDSLVLLADKCFFKTKKKGEIVDGKPSKFDRKKDTEAKLFEFAAGQHPDHSDKINITILSERNMCESCNGVYEQFIEMYPNATVNVVSGKIQIIHKKLDDGTIVEVEVSPWLWRKMSRLEK